MRHRLFQHLQHLFWYLMAQLHQGNPTPGAQAPCSTEPHLSWAAGFGSWGHVPANLATKTGTEGR